MTKNPKNHKPDPAEEALAFLEKEQKEFENHWVWKELQCKPAEFFDAVKKHVNSLNISPEKWREAYKKAKDISRVRSAEKRTSYQPQKLRMIGALRA